MKKRFRVILLTLLIFGLMPAQTVRASSTSLVELVAGGGSEGAGEWVVNLRTDANDTLMLSEFELEVNDHTVSLPITYGDDDSTSVSVVTETDIIPLLNDRQLEEYKTLKATYDQSKQTFDDTCEVVESPTEDTDECSILRQDVTKALDELNHYFEINLQYRMKFSTRDGRKGIYEFKSAQELFKTKRIELPLEENTNNPYPDLDLKEGEYLLIRYAGYGYFGSDYYRAYIRLFTSDDVYIESIDTYINGIKANTQKQEKNVLIHSGYPITISEFESFLYDEAQSEEKEQLIIKEEYKDLLSTEQIDALRDFYTMASRTTPDHLEYLKIVDDIFSFDLNIKNGNGDRVTYTFKDVSSLNDAVHDGFIISFDHVNLENHEDKGLNANSGKEAEQLEFDANILPATGIGNQSIILGCVFITLGYYLKRS